MMLLAAGASLGQSYPAQPIRLVVPFPPGGALDVVGRAVAAQVAVQVGQPLVVDNRPGANGIIGTEIVVAAPPTGYTILNNGGALLINHATRRRLSYQLERDLVPVTSLGRGTGYLLVTHPSSPFRAVGDIASTARSSRKAVSYSSAGVGNPTHLAVALLAARLGIESMHVPYKGLAPAITGLLATEVQLLSSPPAVVLPHVSAGRLRALAFTGANRWPSLPDVPTVAENGVRNYVFSGGFVAWHAPAGTPAPIVARLQTEVRKALLVARVREFVEANGYRPGGEPPTEFGGFVTAELDRYREAAQAARLEIQ